MRGDIPRPIHEYSVAVCQVPLRGIVIEEDYLRADPDDLAAFQRIFEESCGRITMWATDLADTVAGVPAFFPNFAVPQKPMLGDLLPGDDLRDFTHFVSRLNDHLAQVIRDLPNCHVLDLDRLAAIYGRRFVQDDTLWIAAHGGFLTDHDHALDHGRLEFSPAASTHFGLEVLPFIRVLWAQVRLMLRVIRGTDAVKMVCVDLDDTMWRGVLAERQDWDDDVTAGWPLGLMEALVTLRRRGIILAIVSKNDPERIAKIWPDVLGNWMPMDSFAIHKIGWGQKAESIRQAIEEANVLPESVVFIDDNPVERAAVSAALPGIRVLGGSHLDWRRILLWSAETQVPRITDESVRRNDMIQAQVKREAVRTTLTREDFLADLQVRLTIGQTGADDPRFGRALELLNKTNQFNTTGRRWTEDEARAYLAGGGTWWTFDVQDRFTRYGLVGLLAERDGVIEQFVMSCRVFGMDVEIAALRHIADVRGQVLSGIVVETERNGPGRTVFERAGWTWDGTRWTATTSVGHPPHIALVSE